MVKRTAQAGFTLIELLVSMFILSIVVVGVTNMLMTTLRRFGYETRLSSAVNETKQIMAVMTTEVRMASALSPYLLPLNQDLTRCTSAVNVAGNGTTLTVRVSNDSVAGDQGREAYLVGYRFDEARGELLRGEVPLLSQTCAEVPGIDPLGNSVAQVIARNLIRIDSDSNGVLDKVFERDGSLLLVNLGLRVETRDSGFTSIPLPISISVRSL